MPGLFYELGGGSQAGEVAMRGAIGLRLDYHPIPTFSRLPAYAKRPSITSARRWGLGGYAELAWQHDERDDDDLRIGAGIALAVARGSSHSAIGLGANALLGQHGATIGADATLHLNELVALRGGVTRGDELAFHASLMITVPAGVIAILVPFAM
jgi:hypothetical protein